MISNVVSFLVFEDSEGANVHSRFLESSGYSLNDKIKDGVSFKQMFVWDNSYGVYLYWDDDFVANLKKLSETHKAHIYGLMWDSNIGLMWFDSDKSVSHGRINLNSVFSGSTSINLANAEDIVKSLSAEEQSLLCLNSPRMSGFFSGFQKLVAAIYNVEKEL